MKGVGLLMQAAFNAVMNMWNKKPLKVHGSRMCESLLAILCHIIRGENVIKVSVAQSMLVECFVFPITHTHR